jgi:hypothetical protein
MNYATLAAEISRRSGTELRPPVADDLQKLTDFGAPKSLLDFYRQHEPRLEAEIGQVRLQNIFGIIQENTMYVPGADLYGYGLFAFATTIYGDAYCLDLNTDAGKDDPPVVIMTHEEPFEGLDHAIIMSARKRVAESLYDFLKRFLAESLDMEPDYPEAG